MANYNNRITNFVSGDDLEIERTVSNIPVGQTITDAWLTIKRSYTDADNKAVIQKRISTIFSGTTGHISDNGADGTAVITFFIVASETALLYPNAEYVYDIQIKTSAGHISTPETGKIVTLPQVTKTIV